MRSLTVPREYSYAGIFLTFACAKRCDYCLTTWAGSPRQVPLWPGEKWIAAINRLELPADLPVTLQGGEPTGHPDFYEIIAGIRPELRIDLLTNLDFDLDEFERRVRPERLRRDAPYASIRVSYHPPHPDPDRLFDQVCRLQEHGYSIGIWGIVHPRHRAEVASAQSRARARGLDFRTKEILGRIDGQLHGTYRYPEAMAGKIYSGQCRGRELLVAPDGQIHRCHHDLYAGVNPLGSLGDERVELSYRFRNCVAAGECHPCDIKEKTDRFQRTGYCAVEIVSPATE